MTRKPRQHLTSWWPWHNSSASNFLSQDSWCGICGGQCSIGDDYSRSPLLFFFVIDFMQGIYSYIPEGNRVVRVYSIAAFLYLQFVLRVMLFGMCSMFCTFTSRSMCVVPIFFKFFDFVLSRYVAEALSGWFCYGYSCPYYYWYHFHIPHAPNLCYKVFIC